MFSFQGRRVRFPCGEGGLLKSSSALYWIAGLLCLLPCVAAFAGSPPNAPPGACVVDRETWQLPACALEIRHGHTYVAARYLPKLFSGKRGPLVAMIVPDHGWSYIDRSGKVVVRHVAVMDNYASKFHYGLVRVTEAGKWGLADRRGRLVVPLRYDGILDYQPGEGWKACTGCRTRIVGEYSGFEGGAWITLDRRGKQSPSTSPKG